MLFWNSVRNDFSVTSAPWESTLRNNSGVIIQWTPEYNLSILMKGNLYKAIKNLLCLRTCKRTKTTKERNIEIDQCSNSNDITSERKAGLGTGIDPMNFAILVQLKVRIYPVDGE